MRQERNTTMTNKKPYAELTEAGKKRRVAAIQKELAEKNLRDELIQIVPFKANGVAMPPKVSEVIGEDGELLGHNIAFRVRRNDMKYVLIDGIKTMVPYKETPENAVALPYKDAKVFGNAYAFAKAGTNLKEFYAGVQPGQYFNAHVRTDRVPTRKIKGVDTEQPQDIFVHAMFFAKGLNKSNPYAQAEESQPQEAQMVDMNDLPFN